MPQHPSLPGDPADPPVLHRPVAGPDPGARSAVRRRSAMIAALVVGVLTVSGVGGFSAWKWLDTNVEQAVAGPAPVEGFGSGPSFPSARPSAAGAPEFGGRRPSPSVPPPSGTGRPRRPPPGAPPPGPSAGPPPTDASAEPEPGRIPYGEWQCRDDRPWLGRPVLARPCHSLGGAIRMLGRLESTPGIQADVELSLHDARTDELAAGPYTCPGMTFTDSRLEQSCGPAELEAPHGHRYVVVATWEYTGLSLLPGGSATGPEFRW